MRHLRSVDEPPSLGQVEDKMNHVVDMSFYWSVTSEVLTILTIPLLIGATWITASRIIRRQEGSSDDN